MSTKAYITGVGMVPFQKPGASESYDVMAAKAARSALQDAGLSYDLVQQAYVGYVYGDSTCGQRALYQVGMTGIPVVNVNNNCSTGSSALFLARQAVESGAVDCALALGSNRCNPARSAQCSTTGPARSNPLTMKPTRWWATTACHWHCGTSAVPARRIWTNSARP